MLKLVAPGKRRNKYWLIRGTHNGEYIERSLKVSLRKDAEKKLAQLLKEYDSAKKENVTFEMAAKSYLDFRNSSDRNQEWLGKICNYIGHYLVSEITQNHLVGVANTIYGKYGKSASKNRAIIRPSAAVLHYAAKNKWCDWLRIETFKEPPPETRYVPPEVEQKLLDATEGFKHLMILWLFNQGDRISDILNFKYEDCDFKKKTIRRYISKSRKYDVVPLDDKICEFINKNGSGYIFPWRTRHGVNKWIREICGKLGVVFTPHMARHTLAKRLNDSGAGLKTIMQTLGQSDPKSAIRYQTTDVETIRAAKNKMGKAG